MSFNFKLLVAMLVSCGLTTTAAAYSMSGTVTCEGDGSPLAGVTITAVNGSSSPSGTSDATGAYLITPLFEGSWSMSVDTPFEFSGPATVDLDPTNAFPSDIDYVIDDPACAAPFCGDGTLDPGEACDDGHNIAGDGCSANCTVEPCCGDGVLDPGEQCDDGNNENGDGCSAMCENEGGGEGCTPGYWRQRHHFDSYPAPYAPDTLFVDAFGVDAFPGLTLSQAVKLKGGGLNALGRHAAAALLNAASDDVSYDRTTDQVIASFEAAYDSGDLRVYEYLKNMFETFNEQGCPLN